VFERLDYVLFRGISTSARLAARTQRRAIARRSPAPCLPQTAPASRRRSYPAT